MNDKKEKARDSMKKLYRSTKDAKLLGVCGGLGEYFGLDSTIIRLILLVLLVCSLGTAIILYLLAALLIPKDPGYTDI